jgi:hypothetical protein
VELQFAKWLEANNQEDLGLLARMSDSFRTIANQAAMYMGAEQDLGRWVGGSSLSLISLIHSIRSDIALNKMAKTYSKIWALHGKMIGMSQDERLMNVNGHEKSTKILRMFADYINRYKEQVTRMI